MKKQIYSSYEEVERYIGYASDYVKRAKETMLKYIKDYIEYAGSIGITMTNKPAIISHVNGSVIVYERIGEGKPIEKFSYDDLYGICTQIHETHLVREWNEPEEDNPKECNPIEKEQ